MKHYFFLFCILALPFTASAAGGMSDLSWMAVEAAQTELGLSLEKTPLIVSQNFVDSEAPANLALQTVVAVQDQNQEWTCVSQFAKTPEFFKIIKTDCFQ